MSLEQMPHWIKSISFPAAPRDQLADETNQTIRQIHRESSKAKYEEMWGAGEWERSFEPLPVDVDTSEDEIRGMAAIVEESGNDPRRFLLVLRQDSERYGVSPSQVYELGYNDAPYWPEGGYVIELDDVPWMLDVCRHEVSYLEGDDSASTTELRNRLDELCSVLEYSDRYGIPPVISRGDQ